jgi:hypothetical protein
MLTELERICLKGNATELRRVAKIMGALQITSDCNWANERIDVRYSIEELQERLNYVIESMESLKIVIAQPLKNGKNQ